MRRAVPVLIMLASIVLMAFRLLPAAPTTEPSPLAGYSVDWNNPVYRKANTAAKTNYLSASEKEVIYLLNLVRMNPSLFSSTVVTKYNCAHTDYYESLLKKLEATQPLNILYPDSLCFEGARCHAINSGASGYVGHDRSSGDCKKKWYYNGECCDYGHERPLDIVMALLLDQDVPSLGHREICLDAYKKIGVSIQPHSRYRFNTVIDFHY